MKIKVIRREIKRLLKTLKFIYEIKMIYFLFLSTLTVISGIMPFLTIKAMQKLINSIQDVAYGGVELVLSSLLIYVSINIISILTSNSKSYITNMLNIELNYVVNEKILLKTKSLSLLDYEDEKVYNMIRKAQDGSSTRLFNVYIALNNFIAQLIALISLSSIIFLWNPMILLIIILIPTIKTIYTAHIGYKSYEIEMKRIDKRRKISYINYLMTNNIAYKELQSYNSWNYLIKIFKNNFESIMIQDKKILKEQLSVTSILTILDEIISATIIFNVVKSSITGSIRIGDTVAVINTLSNIQNSIISLLQSLIEMYRENLYVKELYSLLDYKSNKFKGKTKIDKIKEVEFIKVSFQYNSQSEYSLKNISFKIKFGETLCFIGENGSGKTTIIKLLAGFYDNYEGDIKINGIDFKEIDKNDFRNKISVLFQDYNKYELKLRENIGISKTELIGDDNTLYNVINKVGLREFLNTLTDGLDSKLGNWFGGTELSGGQWQKLGIARTLLRCAEIIILDEPTSALDPISEYQMFSLIKKENKDCIKVFISHRLGNILKLNCRIIVLKKGEIVVDGYHDDILKKSLLYKEMLQSETRAI